MWSHWSPQTLLVGVYNGATTLENSSAISRKGKHKLTRWRNSSTARYLPQRNESMYLPKGLCANAHRIVHKSPNVQTAKMFIPWWINEQNITHAIPITCEFHICKFAFLSKLVCKPQIKTTVSWSFSDTRMCRAGEPCTCPTNMLPAEAGQSHTLPSPSSSLTSHSVLLQSI